MAYFLRLHNDSYQDFRDWQSTYPNTLHFQSLINVLLPDHFFQKLDTNFPQKNFIFPFVLTLAATNFDYQYTIEWFSLNLHRNQMMVANLILFLTEQHQ